MLSCDLGGVWFSSFEEWGGFISFYERLVGEYSFKIQNEPAQKIT
jgi:hypothetical protein